MKYFETTFTIQAPTELMQDARDMVAALAGEAGYETFEETDEGLRGYVLQGLYSQETLNEALAAMPFLDVTVSCQTIEAEDRDWNELWEEEGFEPISVGSECIIHDGRHLPPTPAPLMIEIDTRLAFGTGNHETTRMIVGTLLQLPLQGKRVLDCGCGTGILGIVALRRGASFCTAYDIDEWSVNNARHNAIINGVDTHFTSLLGDASTLLTVEDQFDIIMANINRNILLADMPTFRTKMAHGAVLILSGFYSSDIPLLSDKAHSLGLTLCHTAEQDGWACMLLQQI